MAVGLFVGLTTLDFIYLTSTIPQPNQKLVALDAITAAGGPVTNAAIVFQHLGHHLSNYSHLDNRHLGNHSRLLSAIGQHPCTSMIRSDLAALDLVDLADDRIDSPPISSILVTQSTGQRAVISINATQFQATQFPSEILEGVDVVLVDGHQMIVSAAIASLAKAQSIPVVMDGGSWKPGLEMLLPFVDYAICSANFCPISQTIDGQKNVNQENINQENKSWEKIGRENVFYDLAKYGIPHIAITQGSKDILHSTSSFSKIESLSVPIIQPIDTLGAGDFFHGAFCHYILFQDFPTALASAATIAAQSCQQFGTRSWLSSL